MSLVTTCADIHYNELSLELHHVTYRGFFDTNTNIHPDQLVHNGANAKRVVNNRYIQGPDSSVHSHVHVLAERNVTHRLDCKLFRLIKRNKPFVRERMVIKPSELDARGVGVRIFDVVGLRSQPSKLYIPLTHVGRWSKTKLRSLSKALTLWYSKLGGTWAATVMGEPNSLWVAYMPPTPMSLPMVTIRRAYVPSGGPAIVTELVELGS